MEDFFVEEVSINSPPISAIAYINNEEPILVWPSFGTEDDAIANVPSGIPFLRLTQDEALSWLKENVSTETLAKEIRQKRDELLTMCDWTVLEDSPISDEEKTSWKTYRQALRDITSQPEFPKEVVWPER